MQKKHKKKKYKNDDNYKQSLTWVWVAYEINERIHEQVVKKHDHNPSQTETFLKTLKLLMLLHYL